MKGIGVHARGADCACEAETEDAEKQRIDALKIFWTGARRIRVVSIESENTGLISKLEVGRRDCQTTTRLASTFLPGPRLFFNYNTKREKTNYAPD